jgi:hypothetical protein
MKDRVLDAFVPRQAGRNGDQQPPANSARRFGLVAALSCALGIATFACSTPAGKEDRSAATGAVQTVAVQTTLSPTSTTTRSTSTTTSRPTVAAGLDGVVVLWPDRKVVVGEPLGANRSTYAEAVLAGEGRIAVLFNDTIATVASGGVEKRVECRGCSGLAWASENFYSGSPSIRDGLLHVVVFNTDLERQSEIVMDPVDEVVTQTFPDVDWPKLAYPTVIAADSTTVIVSYFSKNAYIRGGPDMLAIYGLDGHLKKSLLLDGFVFRSASSEDGLNMALAVGGTSSACIHNSQLLVLKRDSLEVVHKQFVEAYNSEKGVQQTFNLSDLVWSGSVARTIGEAMTIPKSEFCDPRPVQLRYDFDTAKAALSRSRTNDIVASRSLVGRACDDLFIQRSQDGTDLLFQGASGSTPQVIGHFSRLLLGQSSGVGCL